MESEAGTMARCTMCNDLELLPGVCSNKKCGRSRLRLSARVEDDNGLHVRIGVFQNGGKAGVLTVDKGAAAKVLEHINSYEEDPVPTLRDAIEGT